MKTLAFLLALMLPASAIAQQQPPDIEVLQHTLAMTRSDRNHALDALTEMLVRSQLLSAELAKAQARIKELETAPEKKPAE